MDAINKFFESEMCLYVIIGLFVLLLIIFIIVIISNNKEKKNNNRDNNNYIIDETKAFVLEDEANTNSEIKIIQEKKVLPDVPVMEEVIKENDISSSQEENHVDLPLVDIPIPKVDDTPIDIYHQSNIVEDNINDIQIQVEKTEPIVEDSPNPNEVIMVSQELVVPEMLNEEKQVDDFNIKEEVAVNLDESPQDIKKETVDFPDFSTLTDNVQTIDTKDIEQEILATANQYINSIMSR